MQTEIAEPSGGAWQASKSHTHSLVLLQSLRGASDGPAGRLHVGRRFALGHGKGRPLARALDDVAAQGGALEVELGQQALRVVQGLERGVGDG